jgi:hypothetical protein
MTETAKVKRSAALPFVIVSTEIIRDESLSPLARHLYTVLATYADINSREAKLYRSTLAGVIGKSVDTLDRLVKELADAGIVSVLKQQGPDGVYTSSIYSLHDAERIGARSVQHAQVVVAAPMRLPLPEDTDSGDLGGRTHAATSPHPRGQGGRTDAAGVAAPMRHITRDLEQETLNKTLVDASASTSTGFLFGIEDEPAVQDVPRTPSRLDEQFAKFYAAYPRKIGPHKAREAWDKARRKATAAEIQAGVERFATDPNLPIKKLIPHPTTWLNRGGWLDEPEADENEVRATDRTPTGPDGPIDVVAILGKDRWVLPTPPEDLQPGKPGYSAWAREQWAIHNAERQAEAEAVLQRRRSA